MLVRPAYLSHHISFGLRYRIGQLRISSHPLAVEILRRDGTERHLRVCRYCHLDEVEDEAHFLFRCPIYYEIRGRFHCLYRDGPHTLQSFLSYPDSRCVGLLLREMMLLRSWMPMDIPPLYAIDPEPDESEDEIDIPVP